MELYHQTESERFVVVIFGNVLSIWRTGFAGFFLQVSNPKAIFFWLQGNRVKKRVTI